MIVQHLVLCVGARKETITGKLNSTVYILIYCTLQERIEVMLHTVVPYSTK